MPQHKVYKFYLFTTVLVVTGWAWLVANMLLHNGQGIDVCLFKRFTGMPCPSCGTTTALVSLLHMQWADALTHNVLGYPVMVSMLLIPLWMVTDGIKGTRSLYKTYTTFEQQCRTHPALLLIILTPIVANWLWHLYNMS